MRFATHVTEADFMAAYRLLCKSRHRRIASAIAYALAAAFGRSLFAQLSASELIRANCFLARMHPSSSTYFSPEPFSFFCGFSRFASTLLLLHAANFVRPEPCMGRS